MNHSKIGDKLPVISTIRSLLADIPLAFGLEYIYQQTSSDLSLGLYIWHIYLLTVVT